MLSQQMIKKWHDVVTTNDKKRHDVFATNDKNVIKQQMSSALNNIEQIHNSFSGKLTQR